MELRPYTERDLPELVGLLNEAYKGRHEFIPYTKEKLRAELEEASSVLLAIDERGRVLGLARLHREWYGEEITLCAQPGPAQEEVKERLLLAIEQYARSGEVSVVVDAEDQEELAFFVSKGYRSESSFYQLIAELDKPRPLPPLPEGYLLRSLRPDEEEVFVRVVNTAYEGERLRSGVLARWSAEDPAFSTDWVQVAELKGELVAAVVARTDHEFNRHYHAKRGYLGPAATLPEHRGKGLGKALTAQAMNFLRERGLDQVSLYTWEGNPVALRVTRGLGFRVSYEWKILTKMVKGLL